MEPTYLYPLPRRMSGSLMLSLTPPCIPFHCTAVSPTHTVPAQGAKPARSPRDVFCWCSSRHQHAAVSSTTDVMKTCSLVSLTILFNSSYPLIRGKKMIKPHSQPPNITMLCREQQCMAGKKKKAVRGRNTHPRMTMRINFCCKIGLII